MIWWGSMDRPTLVEAGEYAGEVSLAICATQLSIPQSRTNRVVDGWIELFESGQTPILDLEFSSRTPARLFNALRAQVQLQRLSLKWGDYADLSVLGDLQKLETLSLGGATALTSLEPLARLKSLRTLHIDGCTRVTDYGPVGQLNGLERLSVTRGASGSNQSVETLEFVRGLVNLTSLTFDLRVESLDYSPLLSLQHAELINVRPIRGMSPSMIDLEWAVPGIAASAAMKDVDSQRVWTAVSIEPPWLERTGESAEVLRAIDATWASLLDGTRTRLEAIVWGRESVRSTLSLAQDALNALANLTGFAWAHPPDSVHLRLFRWLEEWRAAVRQYETDPEGEPRRAALRSVAKLVLSDPDHARLQFDDYVEAGLLGPDDEVALGLPADDGCRPGGT